MVRLQKKLLLVEDEAIIAMAEEQILKGFGYSVLSESSGEGAVRRALEDESISLILMDIDLGQGIDGTEAARRILDKRDIPIVFLTSHSEQEMVERVRGITRYGYVIKNSGDFVLQSSVEMAFELFEAQRRTRESEDQLRALVRTIPDLVWLKDVDGVYLGCNSRFEQFFNAPESEIVGKTDYDFVDRSLSDFFREHDLMAMEAGKPVDNEEWITFAVDGSRALLETRKTPMFNREGKLIGVLGIGRDITRRKQIENELRSSEQRFHSALNNIPDVITMYDRDLRITYVNSATSAITGLDPSDIIGKRDSEIWPDKHMLWRQALLKCLNTGSTEVVEIDFPGDRGTRRLRITCIPLRDEAGEVREVMGITRNLTDNQEIS